MRILELYSSSGMSKPGRRRGNGGPSISGLNTGRCGWKKKNTKHKLSCESQIMSIRREYFFYVDFNRYNFPRFGKHSLKRRKRGEGEWHVLCVVSARDRTFLVFLTPCTRNARVEWSRWCTEGRDTSISPRDKRGNTYFCFSKKEELFQTLITGEY